MAPLQRHVFPNCNAIFLQIPVKPDQSIRKAPMSAAAQIADNLPYLRRYARALTGNQSSGDAYVRSTLEAALADRALLDEVSRDRVSLYAVFTRVWSASCIDVPPDGNIDLPHESAAQERLARITPASRQALLLTTLEDFSVADTAAILDRSEAEIEALLTEAIAQIEGESATEVLIIEDEPLIAMQLEDLVTDLGHTVIGTAATRSQAERIFAERRPALVLADIQLADGSSGIDAVDQMLKLGDVPVIFITAYPEKLLTGDRPEPTYLITKPFQEATVRAAISQVLFFGTSRPLPTGSARR
jgi:CheY-like chemotaxis protein/DNA-directed RNA polymerase specialized sigma24 family protein